MPASSSTALVNIDEGPTEDSCSLPFVAKLGYTPVLGEAMWRLTPDFAIEDGYAVAFAPGYDLADGFPNPDQVVDDFRAMTYTSFGDAERRLQRLRDRGPARRPPAPDPRCRCSAIFGAEDQICDPEESQAAYETVPGAQVAVIEGAGHSPNVEKPQETAALIEEFALDAGDDTIPPPPKGGGGKQKRPKNGSRRRTPGSAPAAAGLRPLVHVLGGAEVVGDPVVAAMADQEHVDVAELGIAVRAARRARVDAGGLGKLAGLPVGALDRPRDDVLEPAEDGAPLAGRLVGAEAVVGLDAASRTTSSARRSSLGIASAGHEWPEDSRARGRPDGPGAARAGAAACSTRRCSGSSSR